MKKLKLIITVFFVFQAFFAQDVFDVARKGTVEQMKELITKTPSLINSLNKDGNSPLLLAVYRGNNAVAKYLVEKGAVIDDNSSAGTPLTAATFRNDLEMVELFLKKGANVNKADREGNNPFYYALMNGDLKVLEKMLTFKPDLKFKTKDNRTITEIAKSLNNPEINKLLNI